MTTLVRVLALASGCGAAAAPGAGPAPHVSSCLDGGVIPAYVGPDDQAYDEHGAERARCTFSPDTHPTVQTTVGPNYPAIPLNHVVLLMMENRSFDHYFGDLHRLRPEVDGTTTRTNPDPLLRTTVRQWPLMSTTTNDTNHEWGAAHLQYDDGAMDGFVMASNPDGARAMGYYTCDDVPFYYAMANRFAISDRHFSSLLGPTWPNRLFTVAATSCGFGEGSDSNPRLTLDCGLKRDNLFKQLDRASPKVTYEVFDDGIPTASSLFLLTGALTDVTAYGTIGDFEDRAASDTLPAVSIVEPHYQAQADKLKFLDVGEVNDDHPPSDIRHAQAFVHRIVKAIASSPGWGSTALFITYDEHGGFYDHVPPPPACDPNGPDAGPPPDYHFDRYGFRVPLLVISPYARVGYVSNRTTDHTSILRFIQGWKGLPALTGRDANAWPMLDLFDFQRAPSAPPDMAAIDAEVTTGRQTLCHPAAGAAK